MEKPIHAKRVSGRLVGVQRSVELRHDMVVHVHGRQQPKPIAPAASAELDDHHVIVARVEHGPRQAELGTPEFDVRAAVALLHLKRRNGPARVAP